MRHWTVTKKQENSRYRDGGRFKENRLPVECTPGVFSAPAFMADFPPQKRAQKDSESTLDRKGGESNAVGTF